MSLTLVILLLALGFILVLLEVLVFPGIGISGILGIVLLAVAVYGAYTLSPLTGHAVLGTSLVLSIGLLILSLRRQTWKRITLNSEMTGRANVRPEDVLSTGDRGVTVTRLNPGGKALIKDQLWEVASRGDFIPEEAPVEIIKLETNKIIVKLVN